MKKYISVGDSKEIIPVSEVYIYTYDGGIGKQVIRIYVDPSVKSYDELFLLLNSGKNLDIHEYLEDNESEETVDRDEIIHTNYCKDYKCSYNTDENYPNQYFVEITRKTAAELKAEQNTSMANELNLALASFYENAI